MFDLIGSDCFIGVVNVCMVFLGLGGLVDVIMNFLSGDGFLLVGNGIILGLDLD